MMRVAVIGAGMAGLTAARLIAAAGHDVTVWSCRNYRTRVLLYAGKPNWDLLATITPR